MPNHRIHIFSFKKVRFRSTPASPVRENSILLPVRSPSNRRRAQSDHFISCPRHHINSYNPIIFPIPSYPSSSPSNSSYTASHALHTRRTTRPKRRHWGSSHDRPGEGFPWPSDPLQQLRRRSRRRRRKHHPGAIR